jgi:5-methylcytosine-specific restriction endonuclease McrA
MIKNKNIGQERHGVKQELVDMYGQKCYYCDVNKKYNDLTFDHIFPKSKNGRKAVTKETCVLACFTRNYKKSNRIISIEDYRKEVMGDK